MRTLLCALFALAACGFEKLPAVPGAGTDGGNTHGTLTLAATAGDQQQGTAGAALALMIEVTATNDLVPVENLTIDFTATGGGTLSSSSLRTDVNGKAEVALTLGRTAGANIVTASAANVDSLTFTEMGLAGTAAKLAKLSADPSPTVAGSTLAPLVVLVSDANDNTVANTDVTFAVSAGAGSLSATTVTTGADGHASTTFTLDKKAGPNQVDASIVGASRVSFVATGLVGSVSMLIATSGNGVNASAGAAIPVVVTAIDANGNGVTGVAVGFAVTAGGGHLSAATGTTDANGQVTTTITLGTTPGQNTLVASATGLSSL